MGKKKKGYDTGEACEEGTKKTNRKKEVQRYDEKGKGADIIQRRRKGKKQVTERKKCQMKERRKRRERGKR